jgi:enamine deaminase RidA (YjgF/YER057c/UK114 family)
MIQKLAVHNADKPISDRSSWGMRVSNVSEWFFISGTAAVKNGEIQHPGDAAMQARWAYDSVGRMLTEQGYSWDDVIWFETTITEEVTEADLARMREVLSGVFTTSPVKPVAGTMRKVKSLARPGMLVEIDFLAAR